MKIDEFKSEIAKLGLEFDYQKQLLLEKYYNYLREYNMHTNITAITQKEDVYLKHFYDSLTLCRAMDMNSVENMIDIGSGAGFPGLVIKIFFPNVKLTMLDSNNKKTTFLTKVIKELELTDIEIVNARAEDFAQTNAGKYDLCTSRAVAFIDIIIGLSLPFIKPEGKVILMKGNIDTEKYILQSHMQELGIKEYKIENFHLPISQDERNLVILTKTSEIKHLNYNQLLKRNKKWLNK